MIYLYPNGEFILWNNKSITVDIDPSGIRDWQKKFPEDFVTWKEKFCNIHRFTRDNRLRQFSFRFLHRIIVTKKELNRFHIASDDKCAFCSTPDSIEHTFIECNVSTKFYLQVLPGFNHYHGTTVELYVKEKFAIETSNAQTTLTHHTS